MPGASLRPPFHEKHFDTGEVTLNFAETAGDGLPPLVLLHRLTSRWQSMKPYLMRLAADWHCYALDLRGHGRSSRAPSAAPQAYRAVDYARDLTVFLADKTPSPALLCGFSGGALAAMLAAAAAPERVRGLLLVEAPLYLFHAAPDAEPSTFDWFSMVAAVHQAGMPPEAVAALLQERYLRVRRAALHETSLAITQVDPAVPQAALSGLLAGSASLDETLRGLTCPVIFLQGAPETGGRLWDEDLQRIRALTPQARVYDLPPGAPSPTRQTAALAEFLAAFTP